MAPSSSAFNKVVFGRCRKKKTPNAYFCKPNLWGSRVIPRFITVGEDSRRPNTLTHSRLKRPPPSLKLSVCEEVNMAVTNIASVVYSRDSQSTEDYIVYVTFAIFWIRFRSRNCLCRWIRSEAGDDWHFFFFTPSLTAGQRRQSWDMLLLSSAHTVFTTKRTCLNQKVPANSLLLDSEETHSEGLHGAFTCTI